MPLIKKVSEQIAANAGTVVGSIPANTPTPEQLAQVAAAKKSASKPVDRGTMTKDGYWERKEARDIETGIRIRRSGVWQAALQSTGLLQLNTGSTLADFLALVETTANAGLAYVNKD